MPHRGQTAPRRYHDKGLGVESLISPEYLCAMLARPRVGPATRPEERLKFGLARAAAHNAQGIVGQG